MSHSSEMVGSQMCVNVEVHIPIPLYVCSLHSWNPNCSPHLLLVGGCGTAESPFLLFFQFYADPTIVGGCRLLSMLYLCPASFLYMWDGGRLSQNFLV